MKLFVLIIILFATNFMAMASDKLELVCDSEPCIPEHVISRHLYDNNLASFGNIEVVVSKNSNTVFREGLRRFILSYWLPHEGYGQFDPTRKLRDADNSPQIPIDSALDCRFDNDHPCEDWRASPYWGDYVIEIDNYLRSTTLTFVVTQQYAAANDAAANLLIELALTYPIFKAADKIEKLLDIFNLGNFQRAFVADLLADSIAGTFFRASGILKEGDVVVVLHGNITVIKPTGVTYHYGPNGGSNTSGGSGGSGSGGNGSDTGGGHLGGGMCFTRQTVCTGGGCTNWVDVHPCDAHP